MGDSVLIVDDDPAFRALASRLLSESGFVVVGEAESVAGALETARQVRPGPRWWTWDFPTATASNSRVS
jgi:CheY-like chemotaxis protein